MNQFGSIDRTGLFPRRTESDPSASLSVDVHELERAGTAVVYYYAYYISTQVPQLTSWALECED